MNTIRIYIRALCLFNLLFFVQVADNTMYAQKKDKFLVVNGTVKSDAKSLGGAVVNILFNNQKIANVATKNSGSFSLELAFKKDYTVEISREGYVTQKYSFSTQISQDDLDNEFIDPFDFARINLVEMFPGLDISGFDKPVAKISWDSENAKFEYNTGYEKTIDAELTKVKTQLASLKKKAFEDEMANAGSLFAAKSYDDALMSYLKAMEYAPNDPVAKAKIGETKEILTKEKTVEDSFNEAIEEGDVCLNGGNFSCAKNAYEKASVYKPEDPKPKTKLENLENEKQKKFIKTKQSYDNVIAKADSLFKQQQMDDAWVAYEDARYYLPDEIYPKKKIAEIKTKTSSENAYKKTIEKADKALNNGNFPGAVKLYNSALNIKPDDAYAKGKIAEIDNIANAKAKEEAELKAREELYKKAISDGDNFVSAKDYAKAKGEYQKALSIKPEDKKALEKIATVDQLDADDLKKQEDIKKRKADYDLAIAAADKYLNAKNYIKARPLYVSAQMSMPDEKYPATKIKEIDNILAEQTKAEADKNAKELEYTNTVAKAKKLFEAKEYEKAKTAYQEALGMKPGEKTPKDKITEIDKLLGDKAKAETALKEKEAKYNTAIAEADKLLKSNEYAKAKAAYQKAAGMRPDEKYPKDKITEIDGMVAEKAKAAKEEKEKVYNASLADGDNLFKEKNYAKAKTAYQKAAAIKPNEKYVKDKIAEIDNLLGEKDKTETEKKQKEEAFKNAVSEAEKCFKNKDYANSKLWYEKALATKPGDKQLLAKLAEIEKMAAAAKQPKNTSAQSGDTLASKEQFKQKLDTYLTSLKTSENSGNQKQTSQVMEEIGTLYYENKNLDKAIEFYTKSLKIKEETGDKAGASNLYGDIAVAFYDSGKFETAVDFYENSLKIKEELGDKQGAASVLNDMGGVFENTYRYDNALKYYEQSLKLSEELNNKDDESMLLSNIGNIYYEQRDLSKSIEYLEKSLKIDREQDNEKEVAASLNNIGVMYYKMKSYEKSAEYYEKSLKTLEEIGNKKEISISMNNLGNVNYDWKKYEEALTYYEKSLKIKEEINFTEGIASSLHNIGSVYQEMNKNDDAIKYYNKSNDIAQKVSLSDVMGSNYQSLAKIYEKQNDYRKAYEYYRLFAETKYSLINEDTDQQISEMQVKFEDSRLSRDKEIASLKREIKKQRVLAQFEANRNELTIKLKNEEIATKDAEVRKQRILLYTFILGFLVILVFSVMLYREYNQKKKANRLLQQKNEEINQQKEEIAAQRDEIEIQRDFVIQQRDTIAEQKKEIMDSIYYAERIQVAVLPSAELIEKTGLNMVLLFKPKDIVSGDFYFVRHIDHAGVTVAAAVDCTGHGVPGAFMSMLGIAFLNEIVSKPGVQHAGQVLDMLRLFVMKSLQQTGKIGEQKDGMDISLVAIYHNKKQLEYAGANNAMYYIRDNVLAEYKADKMPIGIHYKVDADFSNTVIDYLKGDVFYLASDGYRDQFGGEHGKKFKSERFKALLLGICEKPIDQQKKILEKNFNEWKGDLTQIDDILVMGVKL